MKPAPRLRLPLRTLALAVTALLAVTGGLFLLLFERVESSESMGPSGRALRDRYWAATLLLEEMGVPTSARYGLGQLPDPTASAVVIVLASDSEHRRSLADRLVPWVEQGGHLVITPPPDMGLDQPELDPLFDAFGIPIQEAPSAFALEEALVEVHSSPAEEDTTVNSILTSAQRSVGASPCGAVVGTRASTTAEDLRMQLRATCTRGTGLVTALSSDDLLQNRQLQDERADNAAFLWDSVSPEARRQAPTQAIFVLRGDAPSFLSLIWNRAWPALTSLALLLLAWASFVGQRFGVRHDLPQQPRRSMLEHLDAAGGMLWRAAQGDGLVDPMRAAVRSRLARRMPALAHLQGAELAQATAEATGQPLPMVQLALVDPPPRDRPGFVRMARALQVLWRDA